MSQQIEQSYYGLAKAWAAEYIKEMLFRVIVKTPDHSQTIMTFDPFVSNVVASNPFRVTNISFTQGVNQAGGFSVTINDSIDRIVDRDRLDNGTIWIIQGGRKGYESRIVNMFYGLCNNVDDFRRRGPFREYTFTGIGTVGIANNVLINFRQTAKREDILSTAFASDKKFVAWRILRRLFEDETLLPVSGGGHQTLQQRGNFTLEGISELIELIIPHLDFPLVYASQVLAHIADMVGADVYVDEQNRVQFHFPKVDEDVTYVKDYYDATLSADFADLAYNTSYLTADYTRRGSTSPSDGFANYLAGVTRSIESLNIVESEQSNWTSLVKTDVAQQFIPTISALHYIAFVLSRVGNGCNANIESPTDAKVRIRVVADVGGQPLGGLITEFFIPVNDIDFSPTVIAPPPANKNVTLSPGQKYWIIFSRKGIEEEHTIRVWNDNSSKTTPGTRSAVRLVQVDDITGSESPPATNHTLGTWIWSASGPTYSYAVSDPGKTIVLEMGDPLSQDRWGQVDGRVELPGGDQRQLGEYMTHVLLWSAKKRLIYDFPQVTIPIRPMKPGRPISVRDQVLGITGVNEVDAYAIAQEVTYDINAYDYGLGTNVCRMTALGFQNPLDYTTDY
jgi:hypothetical protein